MVRAGRWASATMVTLLLAVNGCSAGAARRPATEAATRPPAPAAPAAPAPPAAPAAALPSEPPPTAATPPTAPAGVIEISYRVERQTSDPATALFEATVDATLADARGWRRAGFDLRPDPGGPYRIVLAEPDQAEALCRPYDVFHAYSCQNGAVVVINAERWRHATPQWTGDLATYRIMLVNHEVGHLLGMRHPIDQCPQPGRPALVMAQQSTDLRGCLPNPWPLADEVARAARHDQRLAPAYGE